MKKQKKIKKNVNSLKKNIKKFEEVNNDGIKKKKIKN